MMMSDSLPAAISQLKLVFAFQGHCPSVIDCIDSTFLARTMVVDDSVMSYSHFTDEEKGGQCVIVNNIAGHEVFLLAIDNKFISNFKGGIADCALFDETNFNFVEFKTNAKGHSEAQIKDTYRKAMDQLENTYNHFKEKLSNVGLAFERTVEIKCYIIVSEMFPRETAMEEDMKIEFAQDCKLELCFERTISFAPLNN